VPGERTALIITAAGASSRMGGIKKEFRLLKGKPVLLWCLDAFTRAGVFDPIAITLRPGDIAEAKRLCSGCSFSDGLIYVEGGSTRQESVRRGLKAVSTFNPDWVMIHDGARPWISPDLIRSIHDHMIVHGACVSVVPAHEAMKDVRGDGIIARHLSRVSVLAAQTPQAFRYADIAAAHEKAAAYGYISVDDTDLYDKFVGPVFTVPGDPGNRKITFNHDLEGTMKTGFGFDIHRLVPGRKLVLGGVHIPFDKGEDGYSDGDALIHAIIDALLGSSGLGDIGRQFPPGDPRYKDIRSGILLEKTLAMVREKGFTLCNVDCTVILETPKIAPFMDAIVSSLASLLQCHPSCVSVKAKTGEGLDASGEGRAVEAYAVVLISS